MSGWGMEGTMVKLLIWGRTPENMTTHAISLLSITSLSWIPYVNCNPILLDNKGFIDKVYTSNAKDVPYKMLHIL